MLSQTTGIKHDICEGMSLNKIDGNELLC